MGVETVRRAESYSFGTVDECRMKLRWYFLHLDKTVTEESFEWISEYDKIAAWMSNTEGKGLLLKGDCGRGKSTIILSLLPVMFLMEKNKILKPVSARELNITDTKSDSSTLGWRSISKRWSVILDELGTENKETNYKEPYEPFCNVIDECEKYLKFLCITTNLEDDEILSRYGVRTLDRLMRLCKIIEFEGESYRK